MDTPELIEFILGIQCRRWNFGIDLQGENRFLVITLKESVRDNRRPDFALKWFGDKILIPYDWDEERIYTRLFVTLQFLVDHELREDFTVRGNRVFESHDPPLTGFQKEWFVEKESALLGYQPA